VQRSIDGTFTFRRKPIQARLLVFAIHPRFGMCSVEVAADARDVEMRFVAPAIPSFRIAGFAKLAADRKVALEAWLAMDPGIYYQPLRFMGDVIARDGTVDLGRMQPGSYRFRLFLQARPGAPHSPWGGTGELEIAAAQFEFAAGQASFEMPFPDLSTLRITGLPTRKKEGYSLVAVDATPMDASRVSRHAVSDEDGTLAYADVPSGVYEFRGPGELTMQIEVPAPDFVRFTPDRIRALRVTILDPKGALARAGLATGDRIVAIDGREFESRDELERIRQSIRGEEVTLTVARGGKHFEIVVGLALLRDPRNAGGDFAEAPR
jgi:hypothetical protein